ncbi:MAG TPA: energy transducer TonB [Rhodanobacter sp.]
MDTRDILRSRQRARGAVSPLIIAIIAILALLLVAAWFLIIKPHQELVMADAGGHPSTPVAATTRAAPPPANVASMDMSQLLAEARAAMNEQRYLAPAGNNAFEFYLRVLEKDPGNKVASDALRETFPFAANSAEQAINSRQFGEAQRQIELLTKADPANYTLTILRSKLDAQRKMLDQQQLALEQEKAAQLAAQKAAADKLAAQQLAEQEQAKLAEQQKAQQARTAQQQAGGTAPAANTGATAAGATAAASGPTTPAVLIRAAPARYPAAALRARQEGWVIVSFTVDTEGNTTNVSVVDSQPRRVFDRAAMDAVERYRFTPSMRNGTAVATTQQQRIEFKL